LSKEKEKIDDSHEVTHSDCHIKYIEINKEEDIEDMKHWICNNGEMAQDDDKYK